MLNIPRFMLGYSAFLLAWLLLCVVAGLTCVVNSVNKIVCWGIGEENSVLSIELEQIND